MLLLRRLVKLKLLCGIASGLLILCLIWLSADLRFHTLQGIKIKASNRVRPPVDCVKLFEGDKAEQQKAIRYQSDHPKKAILNEEYLNMSSNCTKFIETRGYIISPTSEDEENFPLAFDILVFKDVELFERLLRAIYRPQNVYCVHVDKKANSALHEAIGKIVGCFDNVFTIKNNIEVTWGRYSVLQSDILCMEALLKYKKWKYFINLTGQEFPLRTHWELVQILKVLNGTNIIGATIKRGNPERLAGRPPPPIDVTPLKGSVHITARREFVEYVINNENAQKLLNWSKLVPFPCEIFFSTLNHNPQLGIPGTYLGEPEYHTLKYPFINRYKIWSDHKVPCHGKYSNAICIFGVGDLPLLAASPYLFANKFHLEYQPLALDCMEELIYNRTQQELLGIRDFNTFYYRELDVVKNHL